MLLLLEHILFLEHTPCTTLPAGIRSSNDDTSQSIETFNATIHLSEKTMICHNQLKLLMQDTEKKLTWIRIIVLI